MNASALSYRKIETAGRTNATLPVLKDLAESALAILARQGERTQDAGANEAVWRFAAQTPEGVQFEIRCHGPDLPATIPTETVFPSAIPKDRQWRGSHRMIIAPPLVAFDICWQPGEPLRIMTFSRGDWEDQLALLASG